jgi:histone-binding protein RBBP4
MPLPATETTHEYDDTGKDAVGFGFAGKENKFRIEKEILHSGEVNRARAMPQQYPVIATKTKSGEVHIFDTDKHPPKPESQVQVKPELRLMGHKAEGNGLSWNPMKKGLLASGSHDSEVCVWDTEAKSDSTGAVQPLARYEFHTGPVEDVAWHKHQGEVFCSVGDDKKMILWDIRKDNKKPTHMIEAHVQEVLSLDFNPFSEYLLATASADRTVGIWDLRNLKGKQFSFKHHQDEVSAVTWAPFNESILASASVDRRVFVWDLSRVGKTLTPEEQLDGPPELLFIHGGHTSKITDLSWNPNEELILASTAEDNVVQVWQIVSGVQHP